MDDFTNGKVGTFDDELQALVDYGHDCCARIDDKIHERCEHIRKAHEQELDDMRALYEIALFWKNEQTQPTTYDTLGNERNKAVCKLREMPDCYPEYSAFPFAKWYEGLSIALGINKGEVSCAKVRDTLIHLLGGDQEPAKFKDLFGIWKEERDAMDAGRCVGTSAGGWVPAADKRSADCADNQPSEGVAPITQELRDSAERYCNFKDESIVKFSEGAFDQLCDAIDAIHANLERENEELHQRTMYPAESERVNMLEREVKRLTAECKTQRNNFDQATSAREHWKSLYEQSLEHIHDLECDYKVACDVNERQDLEHIELTKRLDNTISLPFDKDGKVWRIGDELLDDGIPCEVVGIGPNRLYYYFDMTGTVEWTQADGRRHYKRKPNVENVLEELLREYERDDSEMTNGEIVERFAARLRLAGDDE